MDSFIVMDGTSLTSSQTLIENRLLPERANMVASGNQNSTVTQKTIIKEQSQNNGRWPDFVNFLPPIFCNRQRVIEQQFMNTIITTSIGNR